MKTLSWLPLAQMPPERLEIPQKFSRIASGVRPLPGCFTEKAWKNSRASADCAEMCRFPAVQPALKVALIHIELGESIQKNLRIFYKEQTQGRICVKSLCKGAGLPYTVFVGRTPRSALRRKAKLFCGRGTPMSYVLRSPFGRASACWLRAPRVPFWRSCMSE